MVKFLNLLKELHYELLSSYSDRTHHVSLRCQQCKSIFSIRPDSLFRLKKGCRCRHITTKLSQEYVAQKLQILGFKVLSKYIPGQKLKLLCHCGNIFYNYYGQIRSGRARSCGCLVQQYYKNKQNKRICGEISLRFYTQYKRQANNRKLEFDISPEYMWHIFLSQDRKCAITGEYLVFSDYTQTDQRTTASIDRINTRLGYIQDNIRWVHKIINKIKWNYLDNDFLDLCKSIVFPYQYISQNITKPIYWQSICKIIQAQAKKRKIEYTLNNNYLWQLFQSQNGLCKLSNLPLIFDHSYYKSNRTASLDRIDSNGIYEEGNVQWIHKKLNKIKRDLTNDELLFWAKKIVDYDKNNSKN